MSVKHNLEQWIAQLDYDDTCDISDRQVSDLIRNYAALEARCAALAAELSSVLKDRAVILEDLDNTCFEIGMQRGEKAEAYPTPVVANHDAFLAEVRAQGVEMLREHPAIKLCSLTHVCDEFAAQLRKGVQS